jgi:hypothetical protein
MYVGIDPGVKGGFCYLTSVGGSYSIFSAPMPATPQAIWGELARCRSRIGLRVLTALELVGGFIRPWGENPKGQKNMASGHTMFKFGTNYGHLEMALIAHGAEFFKVVPRSWQKEFGIEPKGKGEKPNKFKGRIRDTARSLFPNEHLTLENADRLLLAEYARRKDTGELNG